MTTKISAANIQNSTLTTLAGSGGGPKISSVTVTDSSYVNLDDTAVALTGGYIKLTGSGFAAGCQVLVGLTPATSVTFTSATEVRVQVPATAAGTYIIYLVNADGGTAIRVNAVTFSGTPTWTGESSILGAADAAISVQLAATGATAYAVAAGSSLPAGVTLSASGLLSGTITGLDVETIYNFVINATDAELQDSPRSFAFTVTAGDRDFKSTTLLLSGSAATFVQDASTNNFPVTIAGDTKPNSFNPYTPGYYSNYFDGTGDFLTTPSNTAFDFGTDSFTVECWVYVRASGFQAIVGSRTNDTGSTIRWSLFVDSNTVLACGIRNTADADLASFTHQTAFTLNQWNHVALVRNGTSFRLYLNGVQSTTNITSSAAVANNSTVIRVGDFESSVISDLNGYVSDLRVVKGTAVYTANFTPSTAPLTVISGTVLLTCQSNRFIDASTNNFAITRNGDTRIEGFDPFVPATEFAGRGSTYFDGNGDYLTAAANTAFDFGTGDFTVEAWVYPINNGQFHPTFLGSVTGWSAGASGHRFNNTGYANKFWFGLNGSGGVAAGDPFMASANTFSFNTWHHYAITRSGNTFRMFVNGVLENTQTYAGSYNAGLGGLRSGWSTWDGANGYFTGYTSDLRLVKGTAVYTTNFTPPAQPLTAIAGTSLLTLQNNTPANNNTFLDSSTNNFLVTRNGNTTQGTFSPYSPSGWSNYFDGNSDWLQLSNNSAFLFGSGDFTLECWLFSNAITAENQVLMNIWDDASTVPQAWDFRINGSGKVFFQIDVATADTTIFTSTATLLGNQWYHLAVTRSGNTFRLFINGALDSTTTNSSTISNGNGPLCIGGYIGSGQADKESVNGYLSNVRIVKGTAVYTSAFTPSTQPLTAIAGTSLLTCADNRFIDESVNNFAITRAGDVRVANFSPFRAVVQTLQTYSAYFDGTGDYLVMPAITGAGTGDFTLEAWLYPTTSGINRSVLDSRSLDVLGPLQFGLTASNKLDVIYSASSPNRLTSTGDVSANTWTHVAVVRNSGTITLYINGVQNGSVSFSGSVTGPAVWWIGAGRSDGAGNPGYYFTGYISNVRVNNSAVYTANFTPSTTPLTAIANTMLLTCQSATLIDNSTNRLAITAAGDTKPTVVNPFGSTFVNSTGYTAAEYSGSMYFDGTGDFLTLPANNSFATGTGDFTIEGWIYVTDLSAIRCICGTRTTPDTTTGWNLAVLTNGSMQIYDNTGYAATGAGSVVVNTWCHFAFVRQSNVFYSYINGIQRASTANTRNWTQNTFWIGATGGSAELFAGHMSDIRFVKGQAVYTSNFVPPLAPVQPVVNTVLLLNATSAAITDATTKNVLETVGDAKISTAVSKFGSSSMSFDGTGDYLVAPVNPNFAFGTGDFTLECWAYFTSTASFPTITDSRSSTGSAAGFNLGLASARLQLYTTTQLLIGSSTLSTNTWYHIAVTRASGTLKIWLNGTQDATVANSTNWSDQTFTVGATPGAANFMSGYLQDLRITRGVARYTANFTAPASRLQIK